MEPPPNFRVRRTGDFWGCLERLEAPDEIYFLTDSVASIGRALSCTVRVTSSKVSRHHCSIHFDSHSCAHLDDNSGKGTLINGSFLVKNDSCDLRSGDELILTSDANGARAIGFRFFLLTNVERFTVSPNVPMPTEPVPSSNTAVAKRSRSAMDEDGPSSGGPNPKRQKRSSRGAAALCDFDSNLPGPSSAVFDPNRPGPSSAVVDINEPGPSSDVVDMNEPGPSSAVVNMNDPGPSSGAVDTNGPGASSNPEVPGASGLATRERTPDAVADENVEPVIVRMKRERHRSSSSDRAQAPPTVITVDDEEFVMSNESFESRLRKKMEQEKRVSQASTTPETSKAVRDFTGGPLADQFPFLETLSREEGEKRLLSVLSSVSDFVMCCICMEYAHDPVTSTNCLHSFCGSCLSKWLFTTDEGGVTRMNCPMCRREISHVTRNAGLASMAAELTNLKSDSERRTAEEVAERNAENKFIDPSTNMYDVASMRRAIAFAAISSRQAAARAARARPGVSGRRGRGVRINDVNFSITVDLDSPNAPAVPSARRGRGRPTSSSRALASSSAILASMRAVNALLRTGPGPSSRAGTSSSRAGTSSSRAGTSSSRAGTSSSRAGTSSSRAGTSSSRGGTSSSRAGTSSSRAGTSSSRAVASSSRASTSSSRAGTSSSRAGTSSSRAVTSSSRGATSSSRVGTSSTTGGTSSTRGGVSSSVGAVSPTATWRNELSRIVDTMGLFS